MAAVAVALRPAARRESQPRRLLRELLPGRLRARWVLGADGASWVGGRGGEVGRWMGWFLEQHVLLTILFHRKVGESSLFCQAIFFDSPV